MGGVNVVAKGGGKMLESLGEKRLPGLERALYGDTLNEETSLFGSAVVAALKGDAATDNRLPYSTAHNMYKAVAKIVQNKVEKINKINRAANPLCPLFTQMPMKVRACEPRTEAFRYLTLSISPLS